MRVIAVLSILATAALVPACGSTSEDAPADTSGGGGSAGAGGSDASTDGNAGSGGEAGSGGSAGEAGSAGSGGSAGSTDAGDEADAAVAPCAAPGDPSKAALCLTIAPDDVSFDANDPALDGNGVLVVDVFDTASPSSPDGGTVASLFTAVLPAPDGGLAQGDLPSLVALPMRFEDLPSTVYVRAMFVDDAAAGSGQGPTPGVWLGGMDFSTGIHESLPLDPVQLTVGQGTNATVALHPLRKLRVTVTRAAGVTPAGDGQGPLTAVVLDSQHPSQSSSMFGYAQSACSDVSGANVATLEGFVILPGAGPYYATAILDDLGTGAQGLPPGGLAAIELSGGTPQIPATSQVAVPTNAYTVDVAISLTLVAPAGDAGGDNSTCSSASDAGAD